MQTEAESDRYQPPPPSTDILPTIVRCLRCSRQFSIGVPLEYLLDESGIPTFTLCHHCKSGRIGS